jgi:hypothetical protein
MKCPKCGAEQDRGNQICERCGIVFEKYYKYHPRPGMETPNPVRLRIRPAGSEGPRTFLLPDEPMAGGWPGFGARAGLSLLLLVWGGMLMLSSVESNAAGESFLHLINLPFHEAGHVFFRPFGQFLTSLGGTLGQLLMPLICFGVLLFKARDPFGASVSLWWLGENFLDIAPYINDARAGTLPLLGGNYGHSAPYGFHDWEYILNETGLLHLDRTLALVSHFTGSLVMLTALGWGGLLLYRDLGRRTAHR